MAEVTKVREGAADSRTSRSLLRTAVDDISRLAFIGNVLVRHGFTSYAVRSGTIARPAGDKHAADDTTAADPVDAARRFRKMLEELGPTFVKFGQHLSLRDEREKSA